MCDGIQKVRTRSVSPKWWLHTLSNDLVWEAGCYAK